MNGPYLHSTFIINVCIAQKKNVIVIKSYFGKQYNIFPNIILNVYSSSLYSTIVNNKPNDNNEIPTFND